MTSYLSLTRAGVLFILRDPLTLLFTIAFPIVFLVAFALVFGALGVGDDPISRVVPSVLGFGIAMSAVFSAVVTITAWESSGLLQRIRTLPTPPAIVIASRITVTALLAVAQVVIAVMVGLLLGFRPTATVPFAILPAVLGATLFFTLGTIIASLVRGQQAAMGAANLVVLPLGFLSGVFIPLTVAPAWLATIAQWSPLYQMNRALDTLMTGTAVSPGLLVPVAVLLVSIVVLGGIASRVFAWVPKG